MASYAGENLEFAKIRAFGVPALEPVTNARHEEEVAFLRIFCVWGVPSRPSPAVLACWESLRPLGERRCESACNHMSRVLSSFTQTRPLAAL